MDYSYQKYINGKPVKKGDIVRIDSKTEGKVLKVIHPNTSEAEDWSAPNGGILIESNGGLVLWSYADEDLELIKRKGASQ